MDDHWVGCRHDRPVSAPPHGAAGRPAALRHEDTAITAEQASATGTVAVVVVTGLVVAAVLVALAQLGFQFR